MYAAHVVAEAQGHFVAGRLEQAAEACVRGLAAAPESWDLRFLAATVEMQRGHPAEARPRLQALLATPNLDRTRRLLACNNLACGDLELAADDPGLLTEADQLSTEAVTWAPWGTCYRATRGAVLVDLGRTEEGMALLESARAEALPAYAQAFLACFLARAESARGHADRAAEYLADARRVDPHCPQLKRMAETIPATEASAGDAAPGPP